ncbi:hypothetical protein GCM10011571_33490 [Marinithermofilum abyssi]|uniref:Uncharacterized protein n=1 Tax=Marinithermofilum abyssi TaxID=1571185 RepID=A0A8J2VME1_9BACL|nr:ATP-binding protein [Marinithermofilum abyssi]GGE28677.1 hypothetical protein GCM10011571_33490 [Marinithermofilum abyssi]
MKQTVNRSQAKTEVILALLASAALFLFLPLIKSAAFAVLPSIVQWALPMVVILGILAAVKGGLHIYHRHRALQDVRFYRILPSSDIALDVNEVLMFTRSFGGMAREWLEKWEKGSPYFRVRYMRPLNSNQVAIYIGYPQDKVDSVKDTIRNFYPSCEIHEVAHQEMKLDLKQGTGGFFVFKSGRKKGLPLTSLVEKKKSYMGNILASMKPGTVLDLQFTPTKWKELEERVGDVMEDLKEKSTKDLNPHESVQKKSFSKRLTGREYTFAATISIWNNQPDMNKAKAAVRSLGNTISDVLSHDGGVRFWRHSRANPLRHWNPAKSINPMPLPLPKSRLVLTDNELANLTHLPPSDHKVYEEPQPPDVHAFLVHLAENQRSLADWELNKGAYLGKLVHPIRSRDVLVDYEQLTKHFILTGATGMGKSSNLVEFIMGMFQDWVENPDDNPAATFIDPAQETIAIIMNRIRHMKEKGIDIREKKIKYFNLTYNSVGTIGLNLLHKTEGYPLEQVAKQAAELILSTANSTNLTRTKRYLAKAIQTLLEDDQPHNILGIEDLFRNPDFRAKVTAKVKDPTLKRFWDNLEDKEFNEEVEPILNRLDPLISDKTARRIFCQMEMALNIRKYMDDGYWVFINILGMEESTIKTVVGHLINLYHTTAKKRPKGARKHYLLIDEAHLVQIPLLAKILYEDRKFGFGLGLITQEVGQFNDEELVKAIRTQIGMVLSTAQNEGSKNVEKMTKEHFSAKFLEKLPERHVAVYTRSKKDGRSTVTSCIVSNEPPRVYLPDGKEAKHGTTDEDKALQWGLEFAEELMANCKDEVRPIEEVDEEIAEYITGAKKTEKSAKNPEDETTNVSAKAQEYKNKINKFKKE